MKKLYLTQNILRIVVAVLAIAMLFLPWCTLRVGSMNRDRALQLQALSLIAQDRGEVSEEAVEKLFTRISVLSEERAQLRSGTAATGEALPFDFNVKGEFADETERLLGVVQSEIGAEENKVAFRISPAALVKNGVSNIVSLTLLFKGTTAEFLLQKSEVEVAKENYEEAKSVYDNLSSPTEYDVERLRSAEKKFEDAKEKYATDVAETGFSEELLLKLHTLGIKNAGVLLTLKEVADRTSLNDKALDTYFLFAMIFQDNNLPSWIALIVMLVVPIVCFILALIELIGALKRRKSFSESGINEDSGFFSYLFQIGAFSTVVFLVRGSTLSPWFFVLAGLVLLCVILCSFAKGEIKQGSSSKGFLMGVRLISVLCAALCVFALTVGMSFDLFGKTVTEEAYEKSRTKVQEEYGPQLATAEAELADLNIRYETNPTYEVKDQIDSKEEQIDDLKSQMEYESRIGVIAYLLLSKCVVLLYLILVVAYFKALFRRFALLRQVEIPAVFVLGKYIRHAIAMALVIAVEIFLFGKLVTPFVWFFAGMMLLEIGIAVYKKLARKQIFVNVVGRGRAMCIAGIIPVKTWNFVAMRLEDYRDKKSSLLAATLAATVDPLLDDYLEGKKTPEELEHAMLTLNLEKELNEEEKQILDEAAEEFNQAK